MKHCWWWTATRWPSVLFRRRSTIQHLSGQATNAVWGFATMLAQVIDAEKPDHLGVAFDVKGGTFRNEMLPQYKGTREAAPEELLTQLPLIQRMLTALGVTYIEKPGFEGDDVIATLATMGDKAGYRTLVLSGDRDAFQLVDDNITVLYPGHHFKDLKHMTPHAVHEKYQVTPAQYPDLAALRGETADNIPGVPGSRRRICGQVDQPIRCTRQHLRTRR